MFYFAWRHLIKESKERELNALDRVRALTLCLESSNRLLETYASKLRAELEPATGSVAEEETVK
jgi:hypothetical protein